MGGRRGCRCDGAAQLISQRKQRRWSRSAIWTDPLDDTLTRAEPFLDAATTVQVAARQAQGLDGRVQANGAAPSARVAHRHAALGRRACQLVHGGAITRSIILVVRRASSWHVGATLFGCGTVARCRRRAARRAALRGAPSHARRREGWCTGGARPPVSCAKSVSSTRVGGLYKRPAS